MQRFQHTPLGVRPSWSEQRGGLSKPVLCGDCNNRTGIKYGTEYAAFVRRVAEVADRPAPNEIVAISLSTYPLRIVKQGLVIICATSEPSNNPALRSLILRRDETGMPDGLRLFCFIPAIRGFGRSTGKAAFVEKGRSSPVRLAENSWWPLGWVLTFDDVNIPEAFEVTDWARRPYARKETVTLHLPVRWTVAMGPGDFRSPEQLRIEGSQVAMSDDFHF